MNRRIRCSRSSILPIPDVPLATTTLTSVGRTRTSRRLVQRVRHCLVGQRGFLLACSTRVGICCGDNNLDGFEVVRGRRPWYALGGQTE